MAVLHLSSAARASLILLALARLTSAQLTVQSACYNPDGALAQGNFPCFLDQKNSPCCGGNTICEDSGLCKVLDSVGVSDLIRGTCTDPTWSSPECPAYCLAAQDGGVNVISCQNVTNSDLDFCCNGDVDCCDSGIGRFQIGYNVDVVTIGSQGVTISTRETTSTTSSSSSSTTTTPSSQTTGSSTTGSSTTGSAATAASSTSPANTSGAVTSEQKSSSGLSTGAKAGIGVACGIVGLALIAALAFFLLRRGKKQTGVPDYAVEKNGYEPPKEMDSRPQPAEIMAHEGYHYVEMPANNGR